MNRRNFLRHGSACLLTGGMALQGTALFASSPTKSIAIPHSNAAEAGKKGIKIIRVNSNFEREELIRPFGFKGGEMKEIWQTAAFLHSDSGIQKFGLCTQNVLWSDPKVFSANSESAGNALMFAVTERALQMIEGETFTSPVHLQESILDELWAYGKKITGNSGLKETFILNALVGVDNAAWLLYAAENNLTNFDQLIPEAYKPSLSHHHDKIASIPLMAYNIPISEIKKAVSDGYFFMKIKIGQKGTQEEMLQKDMKRLTAIHKAIGGARTQYTESGKLPYYFDANGRYQKRETFERFLDHANKIGAFDQISVIEEPFPEEAGYDVSGFGVRIASDETAHSDRFALERIQMGYNAMALKPIAKTMSMTMKVAQIAYEKKIPCFCADLTVNPILVEWNKVVAARLASFPGIKGGMGLMESNGHQNYTNWKTMLNYNPTANKEWAKVKRGVYYLDQDYYKNNGGIFTQSKHYTDWFK